MKKLFLIISSLMLSLHLWSQTDDAEEKKNPEPLRGLEYRVEAQGSFSGEKTPLWLNANRYGLSSLEGSNGYLRAAVERPLSVDEERRWGIGYGVDVAVPFNYTSKFVVQQAYAEGRWLHGTLTVGSKQYPMQLKNNDLSSGSQTLGINARPVPQVRLALPDYWTLPFANGWLQLKGHIAYGWFTDGKWQEDFAGPQGKHAESVKYHSKAGYLRIGNAERFFPFSVELGLETASIYGGKAYVPQPDGTMQTLEGETGLKGMWHAFKGGGEDAGETVYTNYSGDMLGSWVMRMNWDEDTWRFSVYADKFFEDHSSMLQVDLDGYQEGDNWQAPSSKKHLFLYDFKDWMLGAELHFKYDRPVNTILFEYLYTKYQSGPIYHDHTQNIADHLGGIDDFYNHYMYPGWQHWGQVMGNPLYLSPVYNDDGALEVRNNRFVAFHLGIDGQPFEGFKYRVLASYQEGWGTYADPYIHKHHGVSFLTEATYDFDERTPRLDGWSARLGFAMDFGGIRGNHHGVQLTVAKKGLFQKNRR